jgi:hypothetical protein
MPAPGRIPRTLGNPTPLSRDSCAFRSFELAWVVASWGSCGGYNGRSGSGEFTWHNQACYEPAGLQTREDRSHERRGPGPTSSYRISKCLLLPDDRSMVAAASACIPSRT